MYLFHFLFLAFSLLLWRQYVFPISLKTIKIYQIIINWWGSIIKFTLNIIGKNKKKFPIPIKTLIHPAAVYIFNVIRFGINVIPFSPNGVTKACSAGPTINPKTCANDTIDTAPVRSRKRVASDKYERHNVIFAKIRNKVNFFFF